VVLGRVVYGSFEVLEEILRMTGGSVPLYLNDLDGGSWGVEWPLSILEIVGAERILPVRSKRLLANYLDDVILASAQRCGNFCLMIYGSPDSALLQSCCQAFSNVVVHGELPFEAPANCWQMADFSDRMHFDLGISVALLLCPPGSADSASLDQLLTPDGIVITAGHFPRFEMEISGRAILRVDPNHAYRGQMERWIAISNLMKSARSSPLTTQ
jgi:hypothetical protein